MKFKYIQALLLLLPVSAIGAGLPSGGAVVAESCCDATNTRMALDFAVRAVENDSDSFAQQVAGFDMHKVFTGQDGDIGTLVFQPYWVNFSGKDGTPYFFDGNDSELTWRIANFNYTALAKGRFNIRVGHFEVPFGLEQNIDTNGTLRQYTFSDRGIKADWGVSVNGVMPDYDYEFAVTRGSGNDYTDRDDPYIVAGRIGSPSTRNLVAGFSFFNGEVLTAEGAVQRKRLGVDAAWYRYGWELLFELSGGTDDSADVGNALAEVSWRNPEENLHSYIQLRHEQKDIDGSWESGSAMAIGVNLSLPQNVSVSGEWSKRLGVIGAQDDSSTFVVQLRYRLQ